MINNKLTGEYRCNCHSYNRESGEAPNVILPVPEHIRAYTDGRETVCIDACIADTIKYLWLRGLPTLNSCCGHNDMEPSVIIPQECEPQRYLDALTQFDDRDWVVSRWERVVYRKANNNLTAIREALGLFESAIKSGEQWTETCEQVRDRALAELQERQNSEGRIEWAAEQAECVTKCLDDLGVPQTGDDGVLSLWGRVYQYGGISAVERAELQERREAEKCAFCGGTGYFQIQESVNTSPCPCTFHTAKGKRYDQ